MADTESKIPATTSPFFVENHCENDTVVQDLHKIGDFVDNLKKSRKFRLTEKVKDT